MARYFYSKDIASFLVDDETRILGELTKNYPLQNLAILQTNAWREQIRIVKRSLSEFTNGHIFFEFAIPRMGKRAFSLLTALFLLLSLKLVKDIIRLTRLSKLSIIHSISRIFTKPVIT